MIANVLAAESRLILAGYRPIPYPTPDSQREWPPNMHEHLMRWALELRGWPRHPEVYHFGKCSREGDTPSRTHLRQFTLLEMIDTRDTRDLELVLDLICTLAGRREAHCEVHDLAEAGTELAVRVGMKANRKTSTEADDGKRCEVYGRHRGDWLELANIYNHNQDRRDLEARGGEYRASPPYRDVGIGVERCIQWGSNLSDIRDIQINHTTETTWTRIN